MRVNLATIQVRVKVLENPNSRGRDARGETVAQPKV